MHFWLDFAAKDPPFGEPWKALAMFGLAICLAGNVLGFLGTVMFFVGFYFGK